MTRMTVAGLTKELEQERMDSYILRETVREQKKDLELRDARVRVLEDKHEEDRRKIETLKEMLRAAETEHAYQRGYLERVREDDAVREAIEHTETTERTHIVSPRQPRNYSGPMNDYDSDLGRGDVRTGPERPATWRDKPWYQW